MVLKIKKMQTGLLLSLLAILIFLSGCSGQSKPAASDTVSAVALPHPSSSVSSYDSQAVQASAEITKHTAEGYETVMLQSSLLGKAMQVNIRLPKDYDGSKRYPVVYLFHGYTGTVNDWVPGLVGENADKLVAEGKIKPMIYVSPEIDNSFGLNTASSYKHVELGSDSFDLGPYEDYVTKELIPYIDGHYKTIASKEGRYVGGISMGGYIALHLAFKYDGLFSRAGGHSPALYMEDLPSALGNILYPLKQSREQNDPLVLAKSKDLHGVKVWLDCGDQDSFHFYDGCQKLYDMMKSKGESVEYHFGKGGHTGDYWAANITNYLLFYGS